MTPLGAIIRRQIAATGPMGLDQYMALCLAHPDHGYYTTRDPLGTAGDFTTAPEISQMFGEHAGLALAQGWLDQGSPAGAVIAELGPGRGTLMADARRAQALVPGMAGLPVHLVEVSPALRAAQGRALAPAVPIWHDTVESLPQAPLFLIANEFLDALPIRQFRRDGPGWREARVGLEGERLALGLGGRVPGNLLADRLADTKDGEVVEICPALPGIIGAIAARITAHGGCAIFIDYGNWGARGDTFQAMRAHGFTDPLAEPGLADLTAHVDFAAIAKAAPPAAVTAMVPQGTWLTRLGLEARSAQLAAGLSGKTRDSHLAATRRLAHVEEMGDLFKAIALYPQDGPLPPGFEP